LFFKKLGEKSKLGLYIYIYLKGFFFGCKVLVNKDVLLGDVVRSDFFFEELFLELGGVWGLGEKWGYSLFLSFFLSFS
jgi:hypothetical protein